MELKIERNELLDGLNKIQTVVEKKSTMPIISNVLLVVEDGRLNLIATDLEVGMRTEHNAEIVKEGKITVPARKLYEMVREIPGTHIDIKEKESGRVNVSSGKIIYTLVGLPADQFPLVSFYEDAKTVEIPAKTIKDLINKTIFSVSLDDTRTNLAGIFIEKTVQEDKEILRMVSSDGHRLSLMEKDVAGIGILEMDSGVILPRKGAREILKLCEDTEKILLGFKEDICVIKGNKTKIVTRLIDGEFPDYRAIIPVAGKKKIFIERQFFLDVLRRTAILSTDKYKAVSFNLSKEKMEVLSVNPDIGDSREELEIEYDGDIFSINFNINYLIEAIGALESKKVYIEFENETNPCIIRGAEEEGFLGIVMPMRV
ncbi:MAG: DNA polymerase III subunit beta [Thermodesulfobacteriota bacterium]